LLAKKREQRPASAGEVVARLLAITGTALSRPPAAASEVAPTPEKRRASAPPVVSGRGGLKRRWFAVAALGVVLLASGLAWWILTPGPRGEPLRGELIGRVYSRDSQKRGLRIGFDDALPVRQGELLHLEAQLNQPAHVYLLWVDGKGVVTPLYPWNNETFDVKSLRGAPLPAQQPRKVVDSPGGGKSPGWRIDNTPGLDTLVLLARKEPLPAGFNLAARLGPMPPAPLDPRNPKEVVIRGYNDGTEAVEVRLDVDRAPEAMEQINNQLLQLMDRLKDDFELIRVVGFAHAPR
jgi:hypothetical protein